MLRYDNNIRNNFRWATFIHHSHLKLGFAAVFSVLLNESLLTDVDSVNLVHEVVPEITVHLIEVVIRFASLQTLKNIKIKELLTKVISKRICASSSHSSNETQLFCNMAPAKTSWLPSTTKRRGVCLAP